ncbi:unnamed protein product [Cylicostephanus goldi]|uniref:Uncharacterized protein n=1 Tax=Cylicostephanus goldi TaxID=71465 RepID=A0A3P6RDT7_CYLGO|nr:unnamed protein product [Cylicostephanus goldi]
MPSTSPYLLETEEEDNLPSRDATTITFLNPTRSSECTKKEKISYFVLFGYRLATNSVTARLRGIDQSSCIMYCSQNIVG